MIVQLQDALNVGGPALWVIFGISVVLLTVGLWKFWHLIKLGAWNRKQADEILKLWLEKKIEPSDINPRNIRAKILGQTILAISNQNYTNDMVREECVRLANKNLNEARRGLRIIDLIITIAPLVGLLGTVLGMIEAFQALQDSGAQADPSALAGGIWEALLTTAAGMGIAIPASILLSWYDSVVSNVQADIENLATQAILRTS
ncbi:MAG: MotA/TolQ/ExbB proton channel family protein [Paracoccaceae bacterium]|jgi:biopolymer transport protein ExbB|nr:MotA/TolQ/ExbB proton channel family protein [Paracoccaceae bacterium]